MNLKLMARARAHHVRATVRPSGYRQSELLVAPPGLFDVLPPADLERDLGATLRAHGSDKSTNHDYHRIYASVLANAPAGPILEIGLGSNNTDVPSNMGPKGVPGASLRGWRSLNLFTEVWGADIDRRVLFSEPGIETRFVDQLEPATLQELAREAGSRHPMGFALIVDDGLHTAEANINVLRGLWPSVAAGGYLCIEDLLPEDLHEVLTLAIEEIPDAQWGLWSNVNRAPDNQILIFRRRA